MRLELIVQIISMTGLRMFPMFSGFGIITSWPKKKCLKEVRRLKFLLRHFLPKAYFFTEPIIALSQKLVLFVWRKDDPRAWAFVVEHQAMFGAIYKTAA